MRKAQGREPTDDRFSDNTIYSTKYHDLWHRNAKRAKSGASGNIPITT